MKKAHRVVNAIGYKRLHPITDRNEQCQYCGIIGGWHSQISDDHVPALNVRVPDQFSRYIRKVIVRACMSCNSLAGDKPHMSFKERSIWLKGKLARRNRRLLKDFDVDPSLFDQPENAALSEREREQLLLLSRLGFGLPAIGTFPESADFLMANGLRLSEQLEQFMFSGKLAQPEPPEPIVSDELVELDDLERQLTRQECIEMLSAEVAARELPAFFDAADYCKWFSRNPSRAIACDLPPDLSELFDDIFLLSDEATQLAETLRSPQDEPSLSDMEIDCFDGPFKCSQTEFLMLANYCEESLRTELRAISALDGKDRLRPSYVLQFWKLVKLHPEINNEHDLKHVVGVIGERQTLLDKILAVSKRPGYVTVTRSYLDALEVITQEKNSKE